MDKKWVLKVSSSVAEDGQSDTIDIPFGVVTCITKLSDSEQGEAPLASRKV